MRTDKGRSRITESRLGKIQRSIMKELGFQRFCMRPKRPFLVMKEPKLPSRAESIFNWAAEAELVASQHR